MTTYNHEAFITECLESIVQQSLDIPYEILIGDDASTDRTVAKIEAFQEKNLLPVRLIKREKNWGYTPNFYDVLYQCQGEYIAIFDGDDIMLPGKLKKQIAFLDANPGIGIVGHILAPFLNDDPSKTFKPIRPRKQKSSYTIEDFIRYGSIFGNSGKVFRKNLIPEGGFKLKVKWIADLASMLEIMSQTKAGFINEPLARYRMHSKSIMTTIRAKENFYDQLQIIRYAKQQLGKDRVRLTYRYTAFCLLFLGKSELMTGNTKRARKLLKLSIRYCPTYRYTQYVYYIGALLFPKKLAKLLTAKS